MTPAVLTEWRNWSAKEAERRGPPPQAFRSLPDGTLLTDQPVEMLWCGCGCGQAVSAMAEPAPCTIQEAGPPPGYKPAPPPPPASPPAVQDWF